MPVAKEARTPRYATVSVAYRGVLLYATEDGRAWSFAERWSRRGVLSARSFQAQYWRLASRAGDDTLVFFPVGRFIEFYGPQQLLAVRTLELHSVALPRAGYAFTAGFPTHLSGFYIRAAINRGLIVVEASQAFNPSAGAMRRVPRTVSIPTRDLALLGRANLRF